MTTNEGREDLLEFDFNDARYTEAPLDYLGNLAGRCPIVRTDSGYAVLKRQEARPILRRRPPRKIRDRIRFERRRNYWI